MPFMVLNTRQGFAQDGWQGSKFRSAPPVWIPAPGSSAVEGSFAALLDAAVKDGIPRQAAILIEGKGESQHFALMVAKPEGLAQLVCFLDEFINEVNRADAFHALIPLGMVGVLMLRLIMVRRLRWFARPARRVPWPRSYTPWRLRV
jgi:hypothetical protein